jgi:hypothetical protein
MDEPLQTGPVVGLDAHRSIERETAAMGCLLRANVDRRDFVLGLIGRRLIHRQRAVEQRF